MAKTITQISHETGTDDLQRSAYFPTLIYSTILHDAESMNAEILKAINEERTKDAEGIERSNIKSLGGWHSKNALHKDKRFDRLTKRAHEMTAGISANLGYDKSRKLQITTMWSIVNPPGSSNRAHIHPGALWSGVYYVQAPKNAGRIEFTDPRTSNLMNSPGFIPGQKRGVESWTKVKVTPQPGKMLFFPSYLYHAVDPNMAEGEGAEAERIIISFNINQVKKR